MPYKSPFNYIGNKYRLVNSLVDIFPKKISTFVDLFCGGGDVLINTPAANKIANDINFHVIEIMKMFRDYPAEAILEHIDRRIDEWQLSKTNAEAYYRFRKQYNSAPNALDLFVLVCFSFNYQFRFNSKHEYNNPFGKDRSCFSSRMRENLISFIELIKNVSFTSCDFREMDLSHLTSTDFLYADPPYSLTCGSYNDGKRGFDGWTLKEDYALVELLDSLNKRNVHFGLSNVIEHKGEKHPFLEDWAVQNSYTIHYADINYNNCNYRANNRNYKTVEVVITNY